MQWRINKTGLGMRIEGRKDENSNYGEYAGIDKRSQLVFYGDLPAEMCDEIESFLETQGIYVDENAYAYGLTN